MDNFRRWHEQKENVSFYNEEMNVSFNQCDKNHRLSFYDILKISSDTAVTDYDRIGLTWQKFHDLKTVFVVSRISFRFHKFPVASQNIRVKTWTETSLPLQFVRLYDFYDAESGELLISGISHWLYVSTETHRIIRTKDFTEKEIPDFKTEHQALEPGKISIPENLKFLVERPIWYSDIDGNGHVNNARYGAFVIDSLPEEYQNKTFTDFRLNFSKEAVQGQNIKIYGNFDDENKKIVIVAKQNDSICFESELFYK